MTSATHTSSESRAGDLWGGLAAMLVALPSAIAFGRLPAGRLIKFILF